MNADEFNSRYPIGTPVVAYPLTRDDEGLVTQTRTPAWELGHGAPVVSVDGYAGGICLTHIDVREISCVWNPVQATTDCDWDRNCPVHGENPTTAATVAAVGALPMPVGPVLRNSSVIPLPSSWSCAYGVSDDEPFCTDEGDEHVCPTIRVHRDDAEQFAALVAKVHELEGERDRYRTAYHSARLRAEARGEGIVRIVGERESYQGWLKQEQEHTQSLRAELESRPSLADVVAWLGKKAREFGSVNGREGKAQAEAIRTMASKISRGAIRPTEGGAS